MSHKARLIAPLVWLTLLLLLWCGDNDNVVWGAALQSVGVKNTLYEFQTLATNGNNNNNNNNNNGNNIKQLMIKTYPAIANYQSDIYEVYAEPYTYDLRAQAAIAVLQSEGDTGIKGEIMFIQPEPPTGPTIIRGNITGLPAGKHGLHIHQSGDLREGCEKVGLHFNPYLIRHGGPPGPIRHVGDQGNIVAAEDGTAEINVLDPLVSLSLGPRGVVGRALVVSMDPDDLGLGGTADSLTTGNSGKSIACGVIAYIR